jgi:hypothetical protein
MVFFPPSALQVSLPEPPSTLSLPEPAVIWSFPCSPLLASHRPAVRRPIAPAVLGAGVARAIEIVVSQVKRLVGLDALAAAGTHR